MGRRSRRRVQPEVDRLVAAIEGHGFAVAWVEYVEDAETPGLLGQAAGVTDHGRRKVKVARRLTADQTVAVLAHELEHVEGAVRGTDRPDLGLECGVRGVLHGG